MLVNIPIVSDHGFLLPIPQQHLLFFTVLIKPFFNKYRCYLIVALMFISLMVSDIEPFSYIHWPFNVFLERVSIRTLCPFLNWIIYFIVAQNSVYILDINSLWDICISNTSFHSGFAFVLWSFSVALQKVLMGCTLLPSSLIAYTLCSHHREGILFKPMKMGNFLFTSSNFIITSLVFKFEIHCIINAKKQFNFILSLYIQFSWHLY